MLIYDKIYGEFDITGVVEELILSEPVQRLKEIHQGGASYLINKEWNVTRFEHSVGVMLLIKKLGGSVEEQIAGLLHDVSHTAFSHVVDYVFDKSNEDYHEDIYETVISESSLPRVLAKHGYDYREILLDETKWTILEQSAPELCADRVDYTLRDMYSYGYISLAETQRFLQDIVVINGKIHLQHIEVAEWFVETYYKEVIDFFMNPLGIYGGDRLAKVLKQALNKKIITKDDFLTTDDQLLHKIKASNDQEVVSLLGQIHPDVEVEVNEQEYDIHQKNKIRLINPSIWINNKFVSASDLSNYVKEMNKVALFKAEIGMYVKLVKS